VGELSYRLAVRDVLAEEMERDPRVVLIGEDVRIGGVFNATPGLLDRFGPERVVDTPISELGFVGAAFGAAIAGLRTVVEIMFADFVPLTLDMLQNHAAKYWYVSNGQASVPLTIRTTVGAGGRFGAIHSQMPTGLLIGIPGIRVAAPANPADVKILLRAAIRDENPVVVFEHKLRYGMKDDDATAGVEEAPGRAANVREGADVTLVAASAMVPVALGAAELLANEDVEAEVVDLRWLRPIDAETVTASVARTGRLVVVEEGPPVGGYAAEVTALAAEAVPGAIVRRVTMPDVPIPFSPALEDAALPNAERVAECVRALDRPRVGQP
jgi:pyruvate/2-oxoglutarate/acetoin dehydrogenase E1 component